MLCAWSFRKTAGIPKLKPVIVCVISGVRFEVDKNCALLGYYAASSGNLLPTFRDNFSVPSSGVKSPKRLKMEPISCPETSVRNNHYPKKSTVLSHFYIQLLCELCHSNLPCYNVCCHKYPMEDIFRRFLSKAINDVDEMDYHIHCWKKWWSLEKTYCCGGVRLSLWNCGFWRASLFTCQHARWQTNEYRAVVE